MKILIMNDFLLEGGAEVYVINLVKLLEENGHDVKLISFDNEFEEKVNKIELNKNNLFNIKISNKLNKIIFFWSTYKKIRKKINEICPDKIIVNNFFSAPFAQYKALKEYDSYQVVHDYHFICPKSTCIEDNLNICSGYKNKKCLKNCNYHSSKLILLLKKIPPYRLEKIRKKYIKQFISPSECLTKYLLSYKYDAICANNPIDTHTLKKGEFLPKKLEKKRKLIYVGMINEKKGIFKFLDSYLEFIEKNENIDLNIIGKCTDIEDEKRLEKYLNNKNIKYLGMKTNKEVIELLEESQFMVVPSLWMENYPTTVLEGMLSGNLVLGSNRGGISDMLANNRGILFDITNTNSILKVLNKISIIEDKEYSTIVTNAFNYTKNNNSYKNYYKKIMGVINDV